MKLLPGILLVVLGTVFLTLSTTGLVLGTPTALDTRAVLLIAVLLAGAVFQALAVRDMLRALRLAAGTSSVH